MPARRSMVGTLGGPGPSTGPPRTAGRWAGGQAWLCPVPSGRFAAGVEPGGRMRWPSRARMVGAPGLTVSSMAKPIVPILRVDEQRESGMRAVEWLAVPGRACGPPDTSGLLVESCDLGGGQGVRPDLDAGKVAVEEVGVGAVPLGAADCCAACGCPSSGDVGGRSL